MGQIVEISGDIRVLRSKAGLVDGQRSPHQRLGLPQPVGRVHQAGQIVELCGDNRVSRSKTGLVDGQRSSQQRLGCGMQCSVVEKGPEFIGHLRNLCVIPLVHGP